MPNLKTFPTPNAKMFDILGDDVIRHNVTCLFSRCLGNIGAFLSGWEIQNKFENPFLTNSDSLLDLLVKENFSLADIPVFNRSFQLFNIFENISETKRHIKESFRHIFNFIIFLTYILLMC